LISSPIVVQQRIVRLVHLIARVLSKTMLTNSCSISMLITRPTRSTKHERSHEASCVQDIINLWRQANPHGRISMSRSCVESMVDVMFSAALRHIRDRFKDDAQWCDVDHWSKAQNWHQLSFYGRRRL